jgi:hypothetical protein
MSYPNDAGGGSASGDQNVSLSVFGLDVTDEYICTFRDEQVFEWQGLAIIDFIDLHFAK